MARPRKERLIRGLEIVRDQLKQALEGCDAEEFDWKPRPDMKSVKDMLRECGNVERVILTYAQTGERIEFDDAVEWNGDDLSSTLSDLKTVRKSTLNFLEELDESVLDETRQNMRGEDTEIEEFIRSIFVHEYYHVGQIIYNRWMLGHNPYEAKG